MRKLLGLFTILCFCACSSTGPTPNPLPAIGCSAETAVTSAVAAAVGQALNCTNLTAVQGDIMTLLGKSNLCQAATPAASAKKGLKGPLGDIVCPLVLQSLSTVITGQIPAAWGCDPSAKIADASAMLNAACSKAIGI